MTHTLRTARCVAALVAFATIAAFNAARANHFILPCRHDCSDPRWVFTGSLNMARANHTATLLRNGKVLVAGGSDLSGAILASAELYDPATGTWSVTGRMNAGHVGHTATLLPNGQVLIVGGENIVSSLDNAELYDPDTGTWSRTSSPTTNRFLHTATLLNTGNVLVAGGASQGPVTAALYDPATGAWSSTRSLITPRALHEATLLQDGRVLVTGGSNDSDFIIPLSDAELYDPVTGTWSNASGHNTARDSHSATLLPDGTVLVAGGLGPPNQIPAGCFTDRTAGRCTIFDTPTDTAELFDPATGQWNDIGMLSTARVGHTATLLPDGEVLVAGGASLPGAELYDAGHALWDPTSDLNTARARHTATRLDDGSVLVVGGVSGDSSSGYALLGSAELYLPARAFAVNDAWPILPRRLPTPWGKRR